MKIKESYITLLYIAITALIALVFGHNYMLNFSVDDSFFYIKTALNNSQGYGSTFDTINITNGYHPLWFIVLTVYYFLINFTGNYTPETIYKLTFLLSTVIGGISAGILHRIIKNITKIDNIQLITIISLAGITVFSGITGMETQLLAMLFLLLILIEITVPDSVYIKSFILGLIFLARIDILVFFLPFMLVHYYFFQKRKLSYLVQLLIIPGITAMAYFMYNYVTFGHLSTISSTIKLNMSGLKLVENFAGLIHKPIESAYFLYFLFIVITYSYLLFKRRLKFGLHTGILMAVNLGALLFLITNLIINNEGIREWYFGLPCLTAALLLPEILNTSKILNKTIPVVTILVTVVYFTLFRLNYYNHTDAYNYAKQLKENTLTSDVIYQIDYSGLIGFYSERKVINGDGLINSFEYYDLLKKEELRNYFTKTGVKYYSCFAYDNPISNGVFEEKLYKPGGMLLKFKEQDIMFICKKTFGGIFRKKEGLFYLIKFNLL